MCLFLELFVRLEAAADPGGGEIRDLPLCPQGPLMPQQREKSRMATSAALKNDLYVIHNMGSLSHYGCVFQYRGT